MLVFFHRDRSSSTFSMVCSVIGRLSSWTIEIPSYNSKNQAVNIQFKYTHHSHAHLMFYDHRQILDAQAFRRHAKHIIFLDISKTNQALLERMPVANNGCLERQVISPWRGAIGTITIALNNDTLPRNLDHRHDHWSRRLLATARLGDSHRSDWYQRGWHHAGRPH